MASGYPRNFGAMLHAFFDGWKVGQESIDFQHYSFKTDPVTGEIRRKAGAWTTCRSLKELIAVAQSWPVTENYTTAQRFRGWHEEPGENGKPARIVSDHNSPILDRIYTDTDPPRGKDDCLDLLPNFKRMQDELEVDGRSPVWIVCSGRGYHSYTYLTRPVSVEEGRVLQTILDYTFALNADAYVPITAAHMMRLPYSKNARTGTWVLSVGRNMTLGGLRNAMKSELLDGCHWENPIRISPEKILSHSSGTRELDEYREKQRERRSRTSL